MDRSSTIQGERHWYIWVQTSRLQTHRQKTAAKSRLLVGWAISYVGQKLITVKTRLGSFSPFYHLTKRTTTLRALQIVHIIYTEQPLNIKKERKGSNKLSSPLGTWLIRLRDVPDRCDFRERKKRNFPREEMLNKQLKTRSVPLNTKLITQGRVVIFKNTKSSA